MSEVERQPHAHLDLASRRLKGLKIERLLDLAKREQPIRMLEVGTGSGGIAHYFGTHPDVRCEVDAVDVHDNRITTEGYHFQRVSDTRLPFLDEYFDVVISNHVIEHVGDECAQLSHLRELRRVMRPDGIGYIAVPNRWMLVEPHYRLAFLSWWPRGWRNVYLRAMRKGDVYDCEPLELHQLERLLAEASLGYGNRCIEALRVTFEIEFPHAAITRLLGNVPDRLLVPLRSLIPTLIYKIWR
jgi:SAM-dependent methyltransferase